MKRTSIILLLLLVSFNAKSQNHLDSLWAAWKNPINEYTIRAIALMEFIWDGPFNNQPDSASL